MTSKVCSHFHPFPNISVWANLQILLALSLLCGRHMHENSLHVLVDAERGPGGRYYWCVAVGSIFCGSSHFRRSLFSLPDLNFRPLPYDYVIIISDPDLLFERTLCPYNCRFLLIFWQKRLGLNLQLCLFFGLTRWAQNRTWISTRMNKRGLKILSCNFSDNARHT